MAKSRFESFDQETFTYRIVNEQPLEVTVLAPRHTKSLARAEYPTLVYWHGGGFVVGHRLYEGWFPPW